MTELIAGPATEAAAGPIFRAAAQVYADGDWPVTPLDDATGFTLLVEGSEGDWSGLSITDDENQWFVFYSIAPVDAVDRAEALSEMVHRMNRGLIAATFELDVDSGEVRLRTGIELATLPRALIEDDDVLQGIVRDLSAANVEVMDRYLSGIVAVSLGADPAAVVAEIEGRDTD